MSVYMITIIILGFSILLVTVAAYFFYLKKIEAPDLQTNTGDDSNQIPRELLKKVKQIEISTRNVVNEVFSGEYHSVFKGRGMEFSEVREYQPGDDVRQIDWNVTARYGTPFIKKFAEERELTVIILMDSSGSEQFGTADYYMKGKSDKVFIDWDSFENKLMEDLAGVDDDLTYKAFAYSILLTGEPQEAGIFNTTVGGGHDMICYRVENNTLYIADPNYPGEKQRWDEAFFPEFRTCCPVYRPCNSSTWSQSLIGCIHNCISLLFGYIPNGQL